MRPAVRLLGASPSSRKMGLDGRTSVLVRAHLQDPPVPGDHVEMEGDQARWYSVISFRKLRSGYTSAVGAVTDCYELTLRETSPEERLAWEVMSG